VTVKSIPTKTNHLFVRAPSSLLDATSLERAQFLAWLRRPTYSWCGERNDSVGYAAQ
jgi:hypothetical protein